MQSWSHADRLIMRNRVLLALAASARARQTQIVQVAAKQALATRHSKGSWANYRRSPAPTRELRGQTHAVRRIYDRDGMFRAISALMLLELAYDLTALGLHDLARFCRAKAAGSGSADDDAAVPW